MNLVQSLLLEAVSQEEQFDAQSVLSKLKSSEKSENINKNAVGFALEEVDDNTNETRIVKVYVSRDQAKDFEATLAAALKEFAGVKEIAEILFDLRAKFNIVNVEWPAIPEDEEVDQELTGDEENIEQQSVDGQELPTTDELNQPDTTTEQDVKTILQAIIDMMKTEAEAKKAEAEAKISQHTTQAALATAKTQEEILDMESYYKEKEEKRKEVEQLARLAKYKQEIKNNEKSNIVDNEQDAAENIKDLPSLEDEEIMDDNEHFSNINKYLTHNKTQR